MGNDNAPSVVTHAEKLPHDGHVFSIPYMRRSKKSVTGSAIIKRIKRDIFIVKNAGLVYGFVKEKTRVKMKFQMTHVKFKIRSKAQNQKMYYYLDFEP
jgi:hypothetical protein